MSSFQQLLMRFVPSTLRTFGYEYRGDLQDNDTEFFFGRQLNDANQAIVSFQRRQHEEESEGYDFTVNLARSRTKRVMTGHPPRYVALRRRLAQLLVNHYGLYIFPRRDHWWESKNERDLEIALTDATTMLTRYGLPWLEDPLSIRVDQPSKQRRDEFQEFAMKIMAVELEALGYRLEENKLQMQSALQHSHWFFIKKIHRNINGFVFFHAFQLPEPDSDEEFDIGDFAKPIVELLSFDTIVSRQKSTNPYIPDLKHDNVRTDRAT